MLQCSGRESNQWTYQGAHSSDAISREQSQTYNISATSIKAFDLVYVYEASHFQLKRTFQEFSTDIKHEVILQTQPARHKPHRLRVPLHLRICRTSLSCIPFICQTTSRLSHAHITLTSPNSAPQTASHHFLASELRPNKVRQRVKRRRPGAHTAASASAVLPPKAALRSRAATLVASASMICEQR